MQVDILLSKRILYANVNRLFCLQIRVLELAFHQVAHIIPLHGCFLLLHLLEVLDHGKIVRALVFIRFFIFFFRLEDILELKLFLFILIQLAKVGVGIDVRAERVAHKLIHILQ